MPRPDARRVAGVFYRRTDGGVELLLVRLRNRGLRGERPWTFPKGKVKPRTDRDDDIAAVKREAREEAGVIDSDDAEFLTFYRYGLPVIERREDADEVGAYLLRMVEHDPDRREEPFRNPTWFTPEEARRKLARGRPDWQGVEHARVLDEALRRLAG